MPWSWAVAIDPIALALIGGAAFKILRRVDKKFTEFQEDWQGTPERPGVPPRAGVMERLAVIENSQVDTVNRLDHVVESVKRLERK